MAETYIDMANRLIRFGTKNETEYVRTLKGSSTHPKNNPGRREMIDTIMRGMARPKKQPYAFPSKGGRVG